MKKMLKRLLCIVLSFVLMLAVVSIGSFSTAALTEKIPTQLYIGGNGEYGNVFQGVNIARMLTGGRKHVGYTYNQNSYRFKYYENDDKDYVLYLDGYNMTEPYVYNENAFGIYCVGDLIIDFCNANSFTVFENIKSIGIYVSGVLTLRSDGGILSSLTAEGELKGIDARHIVVEEGNITSNGRAQYGIETGSLLVKDGRLAVNGKAYGIKASNIGFCGGSIRGTADTVIYCSGIFVNSGGTLEGGAYIDALHADYREVELLKSKQMFYKLNDSVLDGGRFVAGSPFKFISSNTKVVKVGSGQDGFVTSAGRGSSDVSLVMMIGANMHTMDTCKITSDYLPFQWAIIILLFGWIWYI